MVALCPSSRQIFLPLPTSLQVLFPTIPSDCTVSISVERVISLHYHVDQSGDIFSSGFKRVPRSQHERWEAIASVSCCFPLSPRHCRVIFEIFFGHRDVKASLSIHCCCPLRLRARRGGPRCLGSVLLAQALSSEPRMNDTISRRPAPCPIVTCSINLADATLRAV